MMDAKILLWQGKTGFMYSLITNLDDTLMMKLRDKLKRMGPSDAVNCFVVLLLMFSHGCAAAESTVSNQIEEKPDFELQHGDRVVLLGNSLIQNDIEYGYIEYAL